MDYFLSKGKDYIEMEETLKGDNSNDYLNSLFQLGDLLDEDYEGYSKEDIPTPCPFEFEDFSRIKPLRQFDSIKKDFDDSDVAKQVADMFGVIDELDSEFSDNYHERVFGANGAQFSDVSSADFKILWQAVLMRDYRVLLEKFSRKSKYRSVKYDLTILGCGYIIIVSEGKLNICPPHARGLFFPGGCQLPSYGFVEEIRRDGNTKITTTKEMSHFDPKMTFHLAKLLRKLPVSTSKMTLNELLRILEENSDFGRKISPESVFERSRMFVPYYDFTSPNSGLENQLAEKKEFCDILKLEKRPYFPLSTLAEFMPGMGSLSKPFDQLNQNHAPVRWLPIAQGSAETLGLKMIHHTIAGDCGWEFSAGYYKSPHTSMRGIPFLDDVYQRPSQPVNLGSFQFFITDPNEINVISDDPIRPYEKLLSIFRCFTDPKTDNTNLTKEIEQLFYDNGENGVDMTKFAHTLMGFIVDSSIIPQTLSKDEDQRKFLLRLISSTLTADVIHCRLKLRVRDPNLAINPYFKVLLILMTHFTLFIINLSANPNHEIS